jgi:hypothetical protein
LGWSPARRDAEIGRTEATLRDSVAVTSS